MGRGSGSRDLGSLTIGVCGYHYLGGLPWIDSILNASMILGGMGPVDTLKTSGAKLFASLYALYSGLALIAVMGIMLTPIIHRFLHKFHIADKSGRGQPAIEPPSKIRPVRFQYGALPGDAIALVAALSGKSSPALSLASRPLISSIFLS